MAEEEEKESTEKEPAGKVKKGFPVKLTLMVVVVLLVLGGGLAAFKMGVFTKTGEAVTSLSRSAGKDIGPTQPLEPFIVNLSGQGKSYLKTRIELELDRVKTSDELNRRMPQLRDKILTTLSSKSFDEISTLEGKYLLRSELQSSLNAFLTTGRITNIYFTDFIVQ